MDNIEVLLERLGFLKITNKTSNKTSKWSDNGMSVVLVPAMINNEQATMSKNMIPDLGWFNRDRIKFED